MKHSDFLVRLGIKLRLKDYDPGFTDGLTKEEAKKRLTANIKKLEKLQDLLHDNGTWGVLLVFQGLDASGKDGAIEHLLYEVNPAGYSVSPFGVPSDGETKHDFNWRHAKELPERGKIGVFNRSHYEEVLVVRVHPEILEKQRIPPELRKRGVWKRRLEDIRNWETYLTNNGFVVIKFFLNVSKKIQAERLLERQKDPSKMDKASESDAIETRFRSRYMRAYKNALSNTSTKNAPWYIIPADHKWFARFLVSDIVVRHFEKLGLQYPKATKEKRQELRKTRKILERVIKQS